MSCGKEATEKNTVHGLLSLETLCSFVEGFLVFFCKKSVNIN